MRLIDADALNEALGVGKECADCRYAVGAAFCHRGSDFVDACEAIADAPTVEPQRMKGRWTEKTVFENPQACGIREWQSAKCSVCGKYHSTPYLYGFTEYAFCPCCGADMRGEQE